MAKSSIHARGISPGSEQHNKREKELSYVRSDLSHENSSYHLQSIADAQRLAKERYEQHTGQKMQEKAKPIREAVLLISKEHTADDLKKLADKLEQHFGIRTIQAYCHKDEGHYDKITKEWKPNYHAHMVFDWTDKDTGKSLRLRKDELREMQTIVAEELGLERGKRSGKKHIEATQYKAMKEEQDLNKVIEKAKTIEISHRQVEEYSVKGLLGEDKSKTIEGLKTALKNELTKGEDFAQEKEKSRLKIEEKEKEIKGWQFEQDFILKRAFEYLKDKTPEKEKSLKRSIMLHTQNKEMKSELDKELKEEKHREQWKSIEKAQSQSKNKGLSID